MAQFPCFKCGGSGEVAFRHVANGVCFQCEGTGRLSYRGRREKPFRYQDKPGFPVLPEAERSTAEQWERLNELTQDNDRLIRALVAIAGCPYATSVYVGRAVMDRAIEMAEVALAAERIDVVKPAA